MIRELVISVAYDKETRMSDNADRTARIYKLTSPRANASVCFALNFGRLNVYKNINSRKDPFHTCFINCFVRLQCHECNAI